MTELKPCPFCGSVGIEGWEPYLVRCSNLHCPLGCLQPEQQFNRASWNTRPAPSPSREGWLSEEEIEKLRPSRFPALGWANWTPLEVTERAQLNALCDMALSALRPAGDEGNGEEPKVVIPTTFKGNTTTVTADYGLILPTYAAGSLAFLEGYDTRVVKLSDAEAAIFKAALHTESKPTTKPKEDSRGK